MEAKVVEDADILTYVVVCDPGDEALSSLGRFARAERLEAAQITAVGAFQRATVGWFDPVAKQYRQILLDQQCELVSLIGDVAAGEDGAAPATPLYAFQSFGSPGKRVDGAHLYVQRSGGEQGDETPESGPGGWRASLRRSAPPQRPEVAAAPAGGRATLREAIGHDPRSVARPA